MPDDRRRNDDEWRGQVDERLEHMEETLGDIRELLERGTQDRIDGLQRLTAVETRLKAVEEDQANEVQDARIKATSDAEGRTSRRNWLLACLVVVLGIPGYAEAALGLYHQFVRPQTTIVQSNPQSRHESNSTP